MALDHSIGRRVVERDIWLAERKALLEKEKQLTRARDAIARARLELPCVRVEEPYVFDGPVNPANVPAGISLVYDT